MVQYSPFLIPVTNNSQCNVALCPVLSTVRLPVYYGHERWLLDVLFLIDKQVFWEKSNTCSIGKKGKGYVGKDYFIARKFSHRNDLI